jgi:hypothetical protein
VTLTITALRPGTKEMVAIAQVAHPFEFTVSVEPDKSITIIRLFFDCGTKSWHVDAKVADSVFLRADALNDILDSVQAAKEQMHEHLFAELGPYPYARAWMMRHLHIDVSNNSPIPGWAWKRFRENPLHEDKVASKGTFELLDKDSVMPPTTTAKRKVKVIKPEAKKPVKKPKCPIHHQEMKFEAVRGAWECLTEGCKQIALPKRERIEGTLLLGKGKISLRIVYPDKNEPPRLVFISDDNIALDVTDLLSVPLQETIEDCSIDTVIASGQRNAVNEVPFKKIGVTISGSGYVMGVEHAP